MGVGQAAWGTGLSQNAGCLAGIFLQRKLQQGKHANEMTRQDVENRILWVFFTLTLAAMAVTFVRLSGIARPLTPDEKAEADTYIREHGEKAIICYLEDKWIKNAPETAAQGTDEKLTLKYLKYFVFRGADVNAVTDNGTTPLHYAAQIGNIEVANFLVSDSEDI